MAEGKKKVIVYTDWIDTFNDLTDEEAGRLIKHFFQYINDLNPTSDRLTELLFNPIKNTLKRDLKKWEDIQDRNRNNGAKGGRPKQEPIETKNNPVGFSETQNNPEKGDSVSVSVNDSVIVIDSNDIQSGKSKRFVPPSKNEVEEFCFENLIQIDVGHFIDHYTANGWMVGKTKMKDWKAAVRNWVRTNKQFKKDNNGKSGNQQTDEGLLAFVRGY